MSLSVEPRLPLQRPFMVRLMRFVTMTADVITLRNHRAGPMVAPPEPPYCGKMNIHHNFVWFHTSEHERLATNSECARELLKMRAREAYFRRLLRNSGWDDSDLEAVISSLNKRYATATEESELAKP